MDSIENILNLYKQKCSDKNEEIDLLISNLNKNILSKQIIKPIESKQTKKNIDINNINLLLEEIENKCPHLKEDINNLKYNLNEKILMKELNIKKSKKEIAKPEPKKPEPKKQIAKPEPKKQIAKPGPKKKQPKKEMINLKDYFKNGYIFTFKREGSYTVIKQLLSDEADSLVLLVKNNKDGNEYVLKCELLGSVSPQVYNEESVFYSINTNRYIKNVESLLKDKSFIKGGVPELKTRLIMYDYSPKIKTRLFIEEKLDESLTQIIKGKKISIPEIKNIGSEYIKILQYIHANGYLHLDIKPPNLMIKKVNSKDKYYIIDFGISKKWFSERFVKGDNNTFYILNKPHSGEGTPLYKSIHAERANLKIKGTYFNRSEDIEAIGYILLEMYLGELPWKDLENENPPVKRLQSKIDSIKYIKNIPDNNLKKALTIMLTSYNKPYDYEPEYKTLLDLLEI